MGMITCPTCKKKISEEAAACPKCGQPLTPEIVEKAKNEGSVGAAIALVIVLIIGCAIAYNAIFGEDTIDQITAQAICSTVIENTAKYESDVSMLDSQVWDMDNRWVIKMPVKLQNGYGAWGNYMAHCEISKENKTPGREYSQENILVFELTESP